LLDYFTVATREQEYVHKQITEIRTSLELQSGETHVHQLGGSYGAIRRWLRHNHIDGYEAHHIPSKAVVRGWGTVYSLPAIALLEEDHAKTDSYRYKSLKKYQSFLPDVSEKLNYLEDAKERLSAGQLFELIKIELWNIRDQCGDRYDGAISQYLDALEDYLNTHAQ